MDIFSMLLAVAALCSAALFTSVMALVPAAGLAPVPARRYYTIKAPALVVSRKIVVEEIEMGYERGTCNAPAFAARFNPFQFATSQEMEIWEAEEQPRMSSNWFPKWFQFHEEEEEQFTIIGEDPRVEILKAAFEYNLLVANSLALVAEAGVLLPKIKGKKPTIRQVKGKRKNRVRVDVFSNVIQTGLSNELRLNK